MSPSISNHADGVWRRFRKSERQSHASVFHQVEVVGFCKICRKVKGIERVATFIVLAPYEIALVSVYLVGADKKTAVSSHVKTLVIVRLQRFECVLLLPVQVQRNLRYVVMIKIEWVVNSAAVNAMRRVFLASGLAAAGQPFCTDRVFSQPLCAF